jgi:hypothetical protein
MLRSLVNGDLGPPRTTVLHKRVPKNHAGTAAALVSSAMATAAADAPACSKTGGTTGVDGTTTCSATLHTPAWMPEIISS